MVDIIQSANISNSKCPDCTLQKNVIGGIYMDRDPFKKYIKESEPGKRYKGYAWHTAIGLQAVDGLTTSKYLIIRF